MTQLQTVVANSGSITQINEIVRSLSPAGLYGINPATTAGLVLGYYGGEFNGVSVSNGTVTLTASATNYVVANRSTGAVTVATNTTNWLNNAVYMQLYQLVAGASTFTIATTSDKRQAFGSVVGTPLTNPMTSPADLIVGDTGGAPARLAKGTGLQVLRVNAGGTALEWASLPQVIPIAVSDETTALTTGTAKVTFRMPYAFTLSRTPKMSLTTAGTGATLVRVDIKKNGTSIFSTTLTTNASSTTSVGATTPAVLSTSSFADDDEVTIDILAVGSTVAGAGLKVYLIGNPT